MSVLLQSMHSDMVALESMANSPTQQHIVIHYYHLQSCMHIVYSLTDTHCDHVLLLQVMNMSQYGKAGKCLRSTCTPATVHEHVHVYTYMYILYVHVHASIHVFT